MAYAPVIHQSSELAAVNLLLIAGGEAPVTTLVNQRPDVHSANLLLSEASRDVQSEGWSFNTEIGLGIHPSGSVTVNDYGVNGPLTLNVFAPPPNLLSFTVTQNHTQNGDLNTFLDLAIQPARDWGNGSLVFYDRMNNKDGLRRNVIYINPVWLWDFNRLPQEARSYIIIKAKRAYLSQVVIDDSKANAPGIQQEEAEARRRLVRKFGKVDYHNMFNNSGVKKHLGNRYARLGSVDDPRINVPDAFVAFSGFPDNPGDSGIGADDGTGGTDHAGGSNTGGTGGGGGGTGGGGGGSNPVGAVDHINMTPNSFTLTTAIGTNPVSYLSLTPTSFTLTGSELIGGGGGGGGLGPYDPGVTDHLVLTPESFTLTGSELIGGGGGGVGGGGSGGGFDPGVTDHVNVSPDTFSLDGSSLIGGGDYHPVYI